eukprot:COSAG01_NODE_18092_length_1101_cov_2.161677_1_plen_27_part_10
MDILEYDKKYALHDSSDCSRNSSRGES